MSATFSLEDCLTPRGSRKLYVTGTVEW